MTTDLRAALREAAALLREDAQDHIDDARKQAAAPLLQMAERLTALADAPPTVAESDAAKDRDAAKWRKVEPLIKRLCAFEDGPTDLRDLLTVALDVLAAAKEPS